MLEIVNDIRSRLDNVLGLYLDLKKAFDIVDHGILLGKLSHYDIRGKTFNVLTSFPTENNVLLLIIRIPVIQMSQLVYSLQLTNAVLTPHIDNSHYPIFHARNQIIIHVLKVFVLIMIFKFQSQFTRNT